MDYNECVSLINSTEAKDREIRSVVADIYELGPEVQIREYEPKEAAGLVEMISRLEVIQAAQQKVPQQAEKPVQPGTAVDMTPYIGELKGKISDERKAIAKELESALSAADRFITRPKKQEGKLVLPTLSLQDQIGELERISAGFDIRAFSGEQIAIIKNEVNGLRKVKVTANDDFQKNLLAMRDARLKEVAAKLGI